MLPPTHPNTKWPEGVRSQVMVCVQSKVTTLQRNISYKNVGFVITVLSLLICFVWGAVKENFESFRSFSPTHHHWCIKWGHFAPGKGRMGRSRWGPAETHFGLCLWLGESQLHPEFNLLPARSPDSCDRACSALPWLNTMIFFALGSWCRVFHVRFLPPETPTVSPQLLYLWANTRGASLPKNLSTICSAAGKKQHFCLPLRVAGKSP